MSLTHILFLFYFVFIYVIPEVYHCLAQWHSQLYCFHVVVCLFCRVVLFWENSD